MLPSTSLLKAGGAGLGAGLGHALGGVFDAPRQAAVNLFVNPAAHSAVAAANGADDNWNWASMLPGAAGLAAGGLAALTPGMLPFAPAIGAGVAGVGQMIGNAIDPETFHAPESSQLVKALGMDPDSGAGTAASVGVGMLTDPLTYVGGFEGNLAGGAVGGARDALVEHAGQLGNLAERSEELQKLQALASGAVDKFEGTNPTARMVGEIQRELAGPVRNYRPEVEAAMQSIDPLRPFTTKVYKQVDPAVSRNLENLGLGTPFNGRGVDLTTGQVPAWAESRGGWLKPSRSTPPPGLSGGYEGLLENPMRDFEAMRGQAAGLGDLRSATRKAPRFAEALGGDLGDSLYSNPHAMIDDFPVKPMMAKDPAAFVRGNIGGLPLYDARDKINALLAETGEAQARLAGMEPTRLQAMLQRLGLAPG